MSTIPRMIACAILVAGCADSPPPSDHDSQRTSAQTTGTPHVETLATARATYRAERIRAAHLPNVVRIHPKVISGGQPDGDDGFRELKSLGVKTVISVDGAKPDLELAARHGLRYVHLPHGYDGIPTDRARQLAKAVRELEGPIYIHCHHGKHRSPAAATVACIGAGLVESQFADSILKLAGTSESYQGLYHSAQTATRLEERLLAELETEFPETADLPAMAEAMVKIAHTHEHLQQIAAAEWRTPADHPDLDPAHEALLLREHFTELLRTDEVNKRPAQFRQLLRQSEAAAQELERGLRQWSTADDRTTAPAAFDAALERVAKDCKTCHAQYRDVPLQEEAR